MFISLKSGEHFIVKPKDKVPTANLVVKLYSPILLTTLTSVNKACIEYRELGLKIKSPTTYHINDCSGPRLVISVTKEGVCSGE